MPRFLTVRDGRPERDSGVAGDGEEAGLVIPASGRQIAALGVERQRRHRRGMRQLRGGERARPDIPDPGGVPAGDRQVAPVGAVGQEPDAPREPDAGRLLAAGEAGDDHVAILEAHRQGAAVGAPGRGRHGRQAAGERDGPLGVQVPERIAGIPGLAVDHGFRDQVAPARMEDEAPGP